MNIDTRILGYVVDCIIVCVDCADEDVITDQLATGEATIINVYNSVGFDPDGCICDYCHEWVVEPLEDEEEEAEGIPEVFADFLRGLD